MAETRVVLPESEALERLVFDNNRAVIRTAKQMWGLASSLMVEGDVVGKGKLTLHNVCLAGNYAKQLRLFVANFRLCLMGLDLESFLIVRSMYTHVLHLQALEHSKDQEQFAHDWILWDLASDEKSVRNLTQFGPAWKELQEKLYSAGALEKDKERYGDLWSTLALKGPTLMTMADLAGALGSEEAYRIFYPLTSSVTHGADLLNYSRPKEDGNGIEVLIITDPQWVQPNLSASISFLRDTCAHLNTLLGLGKTALIDDMTALVSSLSAKKPEFKPLERKNIDWIERARAKKEKKP